MMMFKLCVRGMGRSFIVKKAEEDFQSGQIVKPHGRIAVNELNEAITKAERPHMGLVDLDVDVLPD